MKRMGSPTCLNGSAAVYTHGFTTTKTLSSPSGNDDDDDAYGRRQWLRGVYAERIK